MADITAGAAIGTTIAGLLDAARGDVEELTRLSCVFVGGLSAPATPEAVSVYLYRAAPSASRHHFVEREEPGTGRRSRRPTVVDLFYWLTAWSDNAMSRATYLLWAMRTIEDFSEVNANVANSFYGTDNPVFRDGETIQFTLDSVPLQDQVNIWERGKANMLPGFGVVVRGIPIDSGRVFMPAVEVQIRKFTIEERKGEVVNRGAR